jgi:hypothetical protein
MLQESDLQNFLDALKASDDPSIAPAQPASILASDDGLFSQEIWRLVCSLQIAAAAGDVPQLAPAVAQIILDDVKAVRCAHFSQPAKWIQAIAWARAQPALANPATLTAPLGREREVIVGGACRRLRARRYKITIGAYGPQIEEQSRRQIVQSAENLVGLLGGLETANQLLRVLNDAKLHHDGMWLFGETVPGIHQSKHPMIPVGWLFSLGLRFFNRQGNASKPAVAWKSLVDLATDFAAAHDCQRYNQYAGMNVHASQVHRALAESTLWREFFSLPQMPPQALRQVLDALEGILTPADEAQLGFAARPFFKELDQLINWSANDRLSLHPSAVIAQALPLLHRLTGGAKAVNVEYGDPLAASERTQDRTLLFSRGKDHVVTLPRALLAPAACELIFRQIWEKLGKRAETITKDTLEHAIVSACQGKAPKVLGNEEYHIGKNRYEIDAATRDGDKIVLIETKGKSLTAQSRSGDMFAFFSDYSDSFLRMLSQLVRHEVHLRQGLTPLTTTGEKVDDLRPVKVAVSPLSYGPVSDKMLSSSLLRSFFGAKLNPITPDSKNQKTLDKLHERVDHILKDMLIVAPQRDGAPQIVPYLIDVFWLDLGQLLYILKRAHTVWDAFSPLKHITFSSRDFWMELANVDRRGLTKGKWTQIN